MYGDGRRLLGEILPCIELARSQVLGTLDVCADKLHVPHYWLCMKPFLHNNLFVDVASPFRACRGELEL